MNRQQRTQEKHKAEAKAVGQTLIGPAQNKRIEFRRYRCNTCNHQRDMDTRLVRQNRFRCQHCQVKQYKAEASGKGLVYVGPAENADTRYRQYRFKQCKHKQDILPTLVRNGQPKCAKCFEKQLKKEAKSKHLLFIGPAINSDANYRHYQFKGCTHKQDIRIDGVRNQKPECLTCFQNKLKKEAESGNLILIGAAKNGLRAYRHYQFKNCRHKQDIVTRHVRINEFECKSCHEKKLTKEAKARNLIVIGPATNGDPNYRHYQFKKCKHKQDIVVSSVRNGYFICNTCEETSRDLPSNVYLLRIRVESFEWLKLGYAKTVNERINDYGLPEEAKVTKLYNLVFDTGRQAQKFEMAIHKKYNPKRLSPTKMKKFHVLSGYEECYPIELAGKLSKEMQMSYSAIEET